MLTRGLDRIAQMSSGSAALAATLIAAATIAAIVFGAVLTPAANVSAVPFVLPTLLATFRGARWVWVTAGSMMLVYPLTAYGLEDVALSAGLINLAGLALFGFIVSWVSDQRARVDAQNAELLAMRRNLEIAMEQSGLRLFSHDRDLRYVWVPYIHPAYQAPEMLGRTDESIFPPDEATELMEIKRRALETGAEVRKEVTVTISGDRRAYDMTVVPSFDRAIDANQPAGPTGLTCVCADVTEFRRVAAERESFARRQEEALSEAANARRNLEQFMSIIAHDLKQPLTVAQGHADMLRRRYGDEATAEQRTALDAVNRAIMQMNRLIGDLQDVASIAQGRFSIHRQQADLAGIVRSVVDDYQGAAGSHMLAFHGPEHLEGSVDPARVSQLLGNLLSNAVKFSPDGSEITIRIDAHADACIIEVTDQGMGMDSDEPGELFEMFSRLDSSQSIQGLGLGLYISKCIAEAHGGAIRVDSEAGKGSTFTVALPLKPVVEPSVEPQPEGS